MQQVKVMDWSWLHAYFMRNYTISLLTFRYIRCSLESFKCKALQGRPNYYYLIINFDLINLECVLAYLIITVLLCFNPVFTYIYQQNKPLINPIHLSKEVLISEPVSEKQNVSMPALLRAPPQVLSDSQSEVPCIMTEPQQVGLVCPHLGQTCWRCG